VKLFRRPPKGSPVWRSLNIALLTIFLTFAATLGIASIFKAPDWAMSLIIVAYPVTWLVTATVIRLRSDD
jgi:hypothetical protein